ncbi:DUF742 domain-containing protein [Actinokineospora xionganensis]|uniref:DUF742 domain-containing protein n=1 Tax=Actinokineospora xionganensis TaxID=2684470 RepID=A0ABR7L4E0_9PSEU|nr:DUF742 domain-containing protein [Actinokineospora xionganensis]MBC6447551.1 DUF742 domain-containing protein [Actinokineospora xionganensis]
MRVPAVGAEAAAGVRLPPRVVKVLLADLIQRRYVIDRAGWNATVAPDVLTMQKVLDGLRAL